MINRHEPRLFKSYFANTPNYTNELVWNRTTATASIFPTTNNGGCSSGGGGDCGYHVLSLSRQACQCNGFGLFVFIYIGCSCTSTQWTYHSGYKAAAVTLTQATIGSREHSISFRYDTIATKIGEKRGDEIEKLNNDTFCHCRPLISQPASQSSCQPSNRYNYSPPLDYILYFTFFFYRNRLKVVHGSLTN